MSVSIARICKYAAIAAVASAGLIQAEEHATFHLPVAAHWGPVVLQPGDYRLTFPDSTIGERTFRVEGDGHAVRELPIVTNIRENSHISRLELEQIDGDYFVREFNCGVHGKSFVFAVPKTNHRPQVATVVNATPVTTSN